MVWTCELRVYPNAANYVSDAEHDRSVRKYWFLVLGKGLFTKNNNNGTATPGTPAAVKREPSLPMKPVTGLSVKRGATAPVKHNACVSPKRGVTAPIQVKREASAPGKAKARSPRPLPLYLNASDDDEHLDVMLPLYRDDSPPCDKSRKRSVEGMASPWAGAKRGRGAGGSRASASDRVPSASARRPLSTAPSQSPGPAISPSISSASSISAATATSSASAAAPRRVAHAAVAHLQAAVSNESASSSRSASTRLLYNSVKRRLYKDAEKAVQEMELQDSVQVVDCADVVEFCAGKSGKMSA
ncbi:hypothetical protein FB451DRAFT_1184471 [Mycena latifolia]|nr:hypothetical protein FB451DRAFT_1184471 [Mycena latifolia]